VRRDTEVVFEIGLEFLMIILLLTILAIALCFIFAGLLMSPRSSEPTSRGISYAARNGVGVRASARPGVRRTGQIAPRSPQMVRTGRSYRSYTEELKRNTWASFVESINVGRIFRPRVGEKAPWIGLTLVLIALFSFGLVLLRTLLPDSTMIVASSWPDVAVSASPPAGSTVAKNTNPFASLSGASGALSRLYQLDSAQYNSQQDYSTWAYSTCSTASMTEVINSYGHNYRIADILKVEAGIHEITPDLGLLEPVGIDRTVAQFGFKTYWLNKPSLSDVLKVAQQGHPVIVGFPPDRWSGGHILIVRGGDSKYVYLADSSRLNMQAMLYATFIKYWAGFAVVVMPN
jgi:Peptidase_C39 like family